MNYLIPLDYKGLSGGEKGCQAVMEMTAPGRILQTILAALAALFQELSEY